jgi:hypothetical protein
MVDQCDVDPIEGDQLPRLVDERMEDVFRPRRRRGDLSDFSEHDPGAI